jgi:molybdate transport system substrate-binding protein
MITSALIQRGRCGYHGLSVLVVTLFIIFGLPHPGSARDEIRVAVAANFIEPFKEIAALFEAKTDIHAEPVFSSTGKIYAQIIEGAPYDMFLSADDKRPQDLYQKGMSEKPFVYAKGVLVLWTARKDLCKEGDWKAVITGEKVKRISVANTETGPYGTAAMTALKKAGLWNSIQDKLVFPQDLAQLFQYAFSGSVDAGFCAISSALTEQGRSGCWLEVKDAPEVIQAAAVLGRSKKKGAAERFAVFLLSPEADGVKRKYGYW